MSEWRTNRKTRGKYRMAQSMEDVNRIAREGLSASGYRQFQKFLADREKGPVRRQNDTDELRARYHDLDDKELLQQGLIGYNGWWNWDTWETKLILDNSESSQNRLIQLGVDWLKRMRLGSYSQEQAEYYVWKYLVPAAQGKGPFAYSTEDGGQDPDIDRVQVNYAEIVDAILDDAREHLKYSDELYQEHGEQ